LTPPTDSKKPGGLNDRLSNDYQLEI